MSWDEITGSKGLNTQGRQVLYAHSMSTTTLHFPESYSKQKVWSSVKFQRGELQVAGPCLVCSLRDPVTSGTHVAAREVSSPGSKVRPHGPLSDTWV